MVEQTNSTARADDTRPDLERAKAIVVEFACAARSAALSLADEQKQRAARQVGGVAEAVRAAARSLDGSQSPVAARYADRAAGRIEDLSRSLHERRWGELVGDVEEVARRRPALFALGAAAAGFLAGRFLSVPKHRDDRPPQGAGDALPPGDAVTAAVSSASGNGRLAGWAGDESAAREVS